MGWYWILIDIVAPALLIAAIIWIYLRNRRNRGDVDQAERGAKELREELKRDPRYRED